MKTSIIISICITIAIVAAVLILFLTMRAQTEFDDLSVKVKETHEMCLKEQAAGAISPFCQKNLKVFEQ